MNEPINSEDMRYQFDEILAQQIIGFLDVDFDSVMMSFNLSSISCAILIVEREKEIKEYADSPPERYDLDSFYSELWDIGLPRDEYLENAVNACFEKGYITKDDGGELKGEIPAFMMVGLLDTMFPGMQGVNLIAFVLQMHEEVETGRKSLELALESFKATLKSRGVAVTKDNAKERASAMAAGKVKPRGQSREASEKLKKKNLERLSELMKNRRQRTGYTEKVRVKDLFDKGEAKAEEEARQKEQQRLAEEAQRAEELARQLAEKEKKIEEAQAAARAAEAQLKALAEKEAELEKIQETAREAAKKEEELLAREALMAERESKLRAMEERIQREEERARREQEEAEKQALLEKEREKQKMMDDDEVEKRINSFENDLSMPCPLCSHGKIVSNQTGKGKAYYSCSESDCRFVSWDKPYHFPCPLCKNPFLIEMELPTGENGLKCPRAACSYTQNNILDPKVNMANVPMNGGRKKKVVIRKKRR